jgi:beta-glucosidase
VAFDYATVERPVRTLAGFKKISLQPGESKTVVLTVNKTELCWYDELSESFKPDTSYVAYVGSNERDFLEQGIVF